MTILIWLFTFLLVVDCLLLMLLVLIQLPKKEAGMGQAFGGGATDALFGAGSGNALTKLTKYTAGIFFALTLLISVLHSHRARSGGQRGRPGSSRGNQRQLRPANAQDHERPSGREEELKLANEPLCRRPPQAVEGVSHFFPRLFSSFS